MVKNKTLRLYHCDISYASQIVRLFFAAKDILWEEASINLLKQEHLMQEYSKINPSATVPTLMDLTNQKIIPNSTDLMVYVEKNYVSTNQKTDQTLLPKIILFCKEQEKIHYPFLSMLSYQSMFSKAKQEKPDKIKALIEKSYYHPNKERGRFLMRSAKGEFTQEELQQAKRAVLDHLDKLNSLLSQNQHTPYLFNSHCFTMADAAVIALLFRINKIGMQTAISAHSLITNFYRSMQKEPCFEQARLC